MAVSKAKRASMPRKDFAGPGTSYPIPDKKHVAIAEGLAAMHHEPAIEKKAAAIGRRKFGTSSDVQASGYAVTTHPHKNLGGYLHPKKGR